MGVALAAFLSVRHTPRPRPPAAASVGRSLREGIAFVRGQPVLLGAMSLDLFSVLFGGATALLPIFADEILRVGPQGLGVLRAAPAAGAVAVSLWLAHRPPVSRTGPVLLGVVAAFGATMIGFGLSRVYALSVALLVVSGGVDMVSVNIRSMLLQMLVPERLLGRVSSVNQIFIGSSNEIGAFESGVAAKLLGAAPSVVLGGVLTLGVVGRRRGWSPRCGGCAPSRTPTTARRRRFRGPPTARGPRPGAAHRAAAPHAPALPASRRPAPRPSPRRPRRPERPGRLRPGGVDDRDGPRARRRSGPALLEAMRARYAGKWYRTLTFVQRTEQVPPGRRRGAAQHLVRGGERAREAPHRHRLDAAQRGSCSPTTASTW
jgi:hypothetical protein